MGGVPPALNQCQMSIGSHDDATIAYCQSKNITYESWGPLRRVDLTDPRVVKVASAHHASAAQVALAYIYQRGVLIATSPGVNHEYIEEDLALANITLADDEMATLDKI